MNIALIGYGKMGKTIEQLAAEKGDSVVLKIDLDNRADFVKANLDKADVAIEFSRPESALENIRTCLESGVPVISGTTGWLEHIEEVKALCAERKGAFFYASNYSIGVNVFFALNRFLAKRMAEQRQYQVSMEEIHHTQKLDAPSGTAITLAEGILAELGHKTHWVNEASTASEALPILSKRIDAVPGTHEVLYSSEIDSISITHTAHSRTGFAKGALLAASWLIGKEGCFGMQDLLGF